MDIVLYSGGRLRCEGDIGCGHDKSGTRCRRGHGNANQDLQGARRRSVRKNAVSRPPDNSRAEQAEVAGTGAIQLSVRPASAKTGPPAPRPCQSCPYRRDVPSGIWAREEYEKLRAYDRETGHQPLALFQCHQHDADSPTRRMCAGWVGCHGDDLLALRLACATGDISPETFEAAVNYDPHVPLFASGSEAADHGQAEILHPSRAARAYSAKIVRRRTDLSGD